MKPKNKFQIQVVEASKTLPKLTKEQIKWGYENGIDHIGHRTEKGVITCTKCGHSWQGAGYLVATLTDCNCPNCNAKLKVETTKKRTFSARYYMTVITTHAGYQVLRSVMLFCSAKVGEPAKYDYSEVMQRWIAPNGKHCTLAKLRQTMGTCYYDAWIFHIDLELRHENSNNKYYMNVYDKISDSSVKTCTMPNMYAPQTSKLNTTDICRRKPKPMHRQNWKNNLKKKPSLRRLKPSFSDLSSPMGVSASVYLKVYRR